MIDENKELEQHSYSYKIITHQSDMINTIRKSKVTKVIASYLAIQMIIQMSQPMQLFALTSGPSQPEFNSFTPIGTSDMVNLSSGNFNYNIPIMDVGGYPLNLAYDSGITMDQEASWVGLGWNLNVGQINRQVRGIPDDFSGDPMVYENAMKPNRTVGAGFNFSVGYAGIEGLRASNSIIVQHNNYEGITYKQSKGIGYQLNDNISIGLDVSGSVGDGATVSPRVSLSAKNQDNTGKFTTNLTGTVGISLNSRKGLESLSFGTSATITQRESYLTADDILNPKIIGGASYGNSSYVSLNNTTFTPSKRAGITNGSFSFAKSVGGTVYGVDFQGQINGFGAYQQINDDDKFKIVPGFGYENTEKGEGLNGMLDFNREKDRSFNKHTTVLPVSNYTYDLYSIKGQGANGMFRPYRSQVSYLYDHAVVDQGAGGNLGIKSGFGWNAYAGGNTSASPSFGFSGKWQDKNNALGKFVETQFDNNPLDYEPSYFKMVGERRVDIEESLFTDRLHDKAPMKLEISGSKFHRRSEPIYRVKKVNGSVITEEPKSMDVPNYKRTNRDLRNQNIQKVTQLEAENDALIKKNVLGLNHHTAGMKVLQQNGSTYVYGETAYNTKKVEATFDVSGRTDVNCSEGTIGYSVPGRDYARFSDQYLNRVTTPGYAHSYLLTSVLSADYEDIDNNGPSINDLGAYTLFEYTTTENNYKWRVPYDYKKASYNEGLKSVEDDQKANYLYGEKELKYLQKIESKTHIAIFHLSDRKDARGAKKELVNSPNPGNEAAMKKIDSISLYSKPEYDALGEDASFIKRAHFVYNYSQCKNVNNNLGGFDGNEISNEGGKLTLKKVYFTYRDSFMGKYTPYVFNYDGFNPDYSQKSFDIWGNYKPVIKDELQYDDQGVVYETNSQGKEIPVLNPNFSNITQYCSVLSDDVLSSEFPYVAQNDKKLQDAFASAWTLTSVGLPSGGELELEYESDDYQYVQDKKAMQMFQITGADNSPTIPYVDHEILFNGGTHHKYIFAKLSEDVLDIDEQDFIRDYLGDQINEPIQFRALLNMVDGKEEQSDYVSGYFEIDRRDDFKIEILRQQGKGTYAAIPLKFLTREGGVFNSNKQVNPIAKAGWYYGQTYLNRIVYSLNGNRSNDNLEEIVYEILGAVGSIYEIFSGPNGKLQEKRSSRRFYANKSWVRLLNPNKRKFGGGVRVAQIKMHDQWDVMTDAADNERYAQVYGQQYSYSNTDGSSSGVATFEPNGSKENPFVKPFYDEKPNSDFLSKDKLVSPQAFNYTEEPFGESFFPSPTVSYGRVEVKNLPRTRTEDGKTYVVKKSATGKVVNEMYTSKNFPTKVDYTTITRANDQTPILVSLLSMGVKDRQHLTMSQGYSIVTNDMNGRMKKQQVFPEDQDTPISEVEYKYNVDAQGNLDNKLAVIGKDGKVAEKNVGVHYDVVNEFRENSSFLYMAGMDHNVTGFAVLIYPVIIPIPIPRYSHHQNILRTATTTKVIHQSGILVEKIARDLGATVSTKNIGWDAITGDVLLTKTVNEYDDYYYNFNYPAHWYYGGMALASKNVGISGELNATADVPKFSLVNLEAGKTHFDYFKNGDELITIDLDTNTAQKEKLWVVHVTESDITLMNSKGFLINQECSNYATGNLEFKIVRSGYRNQQMASMASVTSLINPIDINEDGAYNDFSSTNYQYEGVTNNPKVVNASAVEYTDYWKPQKEYRLPGFPSLLTNLYDKIHNGELDEDGNQLNDAELIVAHKYGFNPYLYNVRGDYRALNSYAYLTGRDSDVDAAEFSTASNGYFTSYSSFYDNSGGNSWQKDKQNWTFASKVTAYSPYGAELENKDALDRYSSAQYGYKYTLPVAVASNSEYKEMGFDGFEDYEQPVIIGTGGFTVVENSHFDFKKLLTNNKASVTRSDEVSHTGKYSLKVSGGSTESVTMYLNDFVTTVPPINCPTDGGIVIVDNSPGCQPTGTSPLSITFNDETQPEIEYRTSFTYNNTCNMSPGKVFIDGIEKPRAGTIIISSFPKTVNFSLRSGNGIAGVGGSDPVKGILEIGNREYLFEICNDGGCSTLGDPVGGTGL